jgi:hypothetical protein
LLHKLAFNQYQSSKHVVVAELAAALISDSTLNVNAKSEMAGGDVPPLMAAMSFLNQAVISALM